MQSLVSDLRGCLILMIKESEFNGMFVAFINRNVNRSIIDCVPYTVRVLF
jgi:hypothetical protein